MKKSEFKKGLQSELTEAGFPAIIEDIFYNTFTTIMFKNKIPDSLFAWLNHRFTHGVVMTNPWTITINPPQYGKNI